MATRLNGSCFVDIGTMELLRDAPSQPMQKGDEPLSGLLEGVHVVETGMLLTVDFLGALLGDEGADVVKVESPDVGDYTRNIWTRFAPDQSIFHLTLNRNKRSITIDAKTPAGRDVMSRLLVHADVFITGNLTEANRRLGLDYETVRALKPDVVYCQVTGFGATGPYASIPTHGEMMIALGGSGPSLHADEDGFVRRDAASSVPPSNAGVVFGPLYGAFGIAAGLARRRSSGEGCYIDISCAEAIMASGWLNSVRALNPEKVDPTGPGGNGEGWTTDSWDKAAKHQYYETSDRRIVLFAAIESKLWDRFCGAIGRTDLAEQHDRQLVVDTQGGDDLRLELKAIFGSRTLREWTEFAAKERVPITPVLQFGDLPADPHVKARHIIVQDDHPAVGPFLTPGNPIVVAGARYHHRSAPDHGQHTREILGELGYDDLEVDALRTAGAI